MAYDPYLDMDMEDYYYAAQDAKEIKRKKEKDSDSAKSSNSGGSLESDRKHRTDPAKIRPKFDKPYWDGTTSTFRAFKLALEGHLLQVGAWYLTNQTFIGMDLGLKDETFKSDVFWKLYKVPFAQATYDKHYLYGILMSSTVKLQHKAIIKHQEDQDGILAWHELKQYFDNDGCKDFKVEHLVSLAGKP